MLYLNADDFGLSEEVNNAVNKCFELGIIYRTSLMVNMDYAAHAINIAKKNGYIDRVGLHLNLTAGIPLTNDIKNTKFCDKNGFFCKEMLKPYNTFKCLDHYTIEAVKKEMLAQCDRFIEMGGILRHIDSHHHIHTNYNVRNIVTAVARESGFNSIRVVRNIPVNRSILKKIYKNLINATFFELNNLDVEEGFIYFADIKDASSVINSEDLNKKIEIMVHPTMDGNNLIDAMNKMNLIEWKNVYKRYIVSITKGEKML